MGANGDILLFACSSRVIVDCRNILNIHGYPHILSANCGYGISPNTLWIFEDIQWISKRPNMPSLVTPFNVIIV
jgi:hypothetical protein